MTPAGKKQLGIDEGSEAYLYDDATGERIVPGYTVSGNPTIGKGRDLVANPLSPAEIDFLFANDVTTATAFVIRNFPWFGQLSPARQDVMVNLAFNLQKRLFGFTHFLAAMEKGDWIEAAAQLKDSEAYKRGPARFERLMKAILGR